MDGSELLKLIPGVIAFFEIPHYPLDLLGVVKADKQGWVFEPNNNGAPRPITRSEVMERGGTQITADEAAELLQPDALDFLKSIASDTNSESS